MGLGLFIKIARPAFFSADYCFFASLPSPLFAFEQLQALDFHCYVTASARTPTVTPAYTRLCTSQHVMLRATTCLANRLTFLPKATCALNININAAPLLVNYSTIAMATATAPVSVPAATLPPLSKEDFKTFNLLAEIMDKHVRKLIFPSAVENGDSDSTVAQPLPLTMEHSLGDSNHWPSSSRHERQATSQVRSRIHRISLSSP